MKILTSNLIVGLLASLCCAAAQEAISTERVKVAPEGEQFVVMMPGEPSVQQERVSSGGLLVSGKRYSVYGGDGEAVYTVWSLKRNGFPPEVENDPEAYLDACAELAWDLQVQPEWERARKSGEGFKTGDDYRLAYRRAMPSPTYPGRDYLLKLGQRRGVTHIYVAGRHIYIVTALAVPTDAGEVSQPELFLKSFSLARQPPEDESAATVVDVEPRRGGDSNEARKVEGDTERKTSSDGTKTLSTKEVTQRARILSKPEPLYTEAARKFLVTGTVRLRVVVSASGEVEEISVESRLPHGMTREAIKAAQKIKFEPAVKDGLPVSQYVIIEYNFNIY